jgi:hypothetical protein
MTEFERSLKFATSMVERFTLTELLVSSMEMIENLPEEQQDAAWQSVFLLIEGARAKGAFIAEA